MELNMIDQTNESIEVVQSENKEDQVNLQNQGREKMRRQLLGNSRCVSDFEKIQEIGEGTYGTVYKARDKTTGDIVALKKVRMHNENDGFPITSLREINILSNLMHPNIVNLKEVVVGYKKDSVFLAFEYCECDIANLVDYIMRRKEYLNLAEIKCLMIQLIKAVLYLHENDIIHRDLKFSNLLINQKGQVKLADFGLARKIGYPLQPYTAKVVTLWYRAPEILLKAPQYSKPIDTWAIGCILAEFLNYGYPILAVSIIYKFIHYKGNNEIDQFKKICDLIGKPSKRVWPDFFDLPNSKHLLSLVDNTYNNIEQKFTKMSINCIDLLNKLLAWDPSQRLTVRYINLISYLS
ncbi:cyclin-dependent kinase 10-like [Stylonychia lemnae]|uniref:Cyclin-dependent kinase 2 homolog n=1 Tax=Stylonychia lemnae TaxID=5949 RepID=A0A077ZZ18_STYLE|nr:cyclin-dependent kinase 10-like [Stylonychia lemnae]|eukprot:CDW75165.1 cyclin-dependent kinase 10-like [Stylonychia lemnae]